MRRNSCRPLHPGTHHRTLCTKDSGIYLFRCRYLRKYRYRDRDLYLEDRIHRHRHCPRCLQEVTSGATRLSRPVTTALSLPMYATELVPSSAPRDPSPDTLCTKDSGIYLFRCRYLRTTTGTGDLYLEDRIHRHRHCPRCLQEVTSDATRRPRPATTACTATDDATELVPSSAPRDPSPELCPKTRYLPIPLQTSAEIPLQGP